MLPFMSFWTTEKADEPSLSNRKERVSGKGQQERRWITKELDNTLGGLEELDGVDAVRGIDIRVRAGDGIKVSGHDEKRTSMERLDTKLVRPYLRSLTMIGE